MCTTAKEVLSDLYLLNLDKVKNLSCHETFDSQSSQSQNSKGDTKASTETKNIQEIIFSSKDLTLQKDATKIIGKDHIEAAQRLLSLLNGDLKHLHSEFFLTRNIYKLADEAVIVDKIKVKERQIATVEAILKDGAYNPDQINIIIGYAALKGEISHAHQIVLSLLKTLGRDDLAKLLESNESTKESMGLNL